MKKRKKVAVLINFALCLILSGILSAEIQISPTNPTTSDVISMLVSGWWGDACVPNTSFVSVSGNEIYFEVYADYPPDIYCAQVITDWALYDFVGPLSQGTYTIYAHEWGGGPVSEPYIFDVSDKQFVLSTESLTVPEGQTATFTVKLLLDPHETVQVTVANVSGDPDITVQSGGSLTFNSSNYSVPQTVTLASAEDPDYFSDSAIIEVSASGYSNSLVNAKEQDNDIPSTIYVDPDATGNNDGTRWIDAHTKLKVAINNASAIPQINEIRVAQGTYTPAPPSGNRNVSFEPENITLKGGYAGISYSDPDERNIHKYQTILSGDLNGNDGPNFVNNNENSKKVVYCRGTVIINGFTISGGNPGSGAGLYSANANVTLIDCTFSRNWASYGGAIYNNMDSTLTLTNCILTENYAAEEGAGIYDNGGDILITNCLFSGNATGEGEYGTNGRGAGIKCGHYTDLIVTNCTFVANAAHSGGGGISCLGLTDLTVTDCIFWANSDEGGMDESAQIHGGSPVVSYSCIQGLSGFAGNGNIGDNPLFVSGPLGDHYLSQSAAGQDSNSPCVDAGSDTAENLEMDEYTTRMDNIIDTGMVDMGYHYPVLFENVADINGDWQVNEADLLIMALQWSQAPTEPSADIAPDSPDNFVNGLDFAVMQQNWDE
ncbi:MAG: right-handed parallel beta-helix repeat-containing protein [Planctomycetota bacterium]|jgi:hypothetical protein